MFKVEIVGLGAGDLDQLPLGIYKKLISLNKTVYTRTIDHPVVAALQKEGVAFHSFDYLYEEEQQFSSVYERIVEVIREKATKEDVIYTVPGHPMLAEKTVQLLLEQKGMNVVIVGGSSYLDDIFTALKIDPIEGFQFVDATSFNRSELNFKNHLVFSQVYDQFVASEVKLTLLEDLPADYLITVVEAVGSKAQSMKQIPLEMLDRTVEVSNLTSVYIPPAPDDVLHHTFWQLRKVIQKLREPGGCPWDQAQTHESLREFAIEEVYELIDAINTQDDDGIVEELGDVLLQVMLHSQIGEDNGYFNIDDVIRGITDKMIHRHPHVFKDTAVNSIAEVKSNWDQLKQAEKGHVHASMIDGVAKHSPSLIRAYQLQKKAAKAGFDWDKVYGVWNKLEEEIAEFKTAISVESMNEQEMEFGDILFVLANLARHYNINPEVALNRANEKFISRFTYIEEMLIKHGSSIHDATFDQMSELWERAKEGEN
jgi:tetrapyrrole methylase family protein / MazG family protein